MNDPTPDPTIMAALDQMEKVIAEIRAKLARPAPAPERRADA